MTNLFSARAAIEEVQPAVAGLPVFITGSSASAAYLEGPFSFAYEDVDIFCSTPQSLMAAAERLQRDGFLLKDRSERVYHRWIRYGFKGWHTNSLKLEHPSTHIEVNLVFKMTDGHPATSLAQVIESFDFGLLTHGYDCETEAWRSMHEYLFPGLDINGPLPLLPNKRDAWRNGFISQYNALRQVGRYVKYIDYGYDMSSVKDDLLTGYREANLYLEQRDDNEEKVKLGIIYSSIANRMEADDIDELRKAGAEILFLDELDMIMEALE